MVIRVVAIRHWGWCFDYPGCILGNGDKEVDHTAKGASVSLMSAYPIAVVLMMMLQGGGGGCIFGNGD